MSSSTIAGKLVDGVFRRVLADEISAPLAAQLLEAGLDVKVPSAHQIDRAIWYRAVDLTSAALFPGTDGLRKLGRHVIDSLQKKNLVKGPFLTMAKLIGVKRALKQAAEYSEAFSPVPLKLEDTGSKDVEIHAEEGQQVEFLAGLLEGLVIALGGKDVKVSVAETSANRSVFAVAWK